MKNTWIADIEVYPNVFYIGIHDYRNKKLFDFEMSPFKDERKEAFQVLSNYDGYWVTFNGLHYDNVVIKYFIKEFTTLKKLGMTEFLRRIKDMSNKVIDDDYEKIKKYKWLSPKWTDIDLSCYWAKSLRITKSISLKSLGIQLNYHHVQELPYPHDKVLTRKEIEEVKKYCLHNDVSITTKLFEEMHPDIALRHYIKKEYGIECWSMDAPKIASEYLLRKFCEKTWDGKGNYEDYIKEQRKYRYPDKPFRIGDYLPEVHFKSQVFKDLFKEIQETTIIKPRFKDDDRARTFEKEFVYNKNNTNVLVSVGVGGIHILNKNEVYRKEKGYTIIDQDVASLYPQLIENHGFLRKELQIVIEEYLALKADRISAKREGNKTKDIFLKLVLNSFTGIADSKVFWVYSPEHLTALRLFGQMIQLRVMEELSEIGIQVISNNTDGTTAIVPDELLEEYHRINNRIAKEFNITWEYAVIDKIAYAHVNGYICIISEKYMVDEEGKKFNVKLEKEIKKKGLFKYGKDIPLGDAVNEQVIAKALKLYFVEGIDVGESIRNPEKYGFTIYDYCKSNKISKKYEVFYNKEHVQNLNRYYFSKGAPYLLKKKKGKATFDHVNVGEGVRLFNIYEEKPWKDYQINYSYYSAAARKIINQIEVGERELEMF